MLRTLSLLLAKNASTSLWSVESENGASAPESEAARDALLNTSNGGLHVSSAVISWIATESHAHVEE